MSPAHGLFSAVILGVITMAWLPAAANEKVAEAKREAGEKTHALLQHNEYHISAATSRIFKLITETGGYRTRVGDVTGVDPYDNPWGALLNLRRRIKWARSIDPATLAVGWPSKYRYRENLKSMKRFKADLLDQMHWLQGVLQSRITLMEIRKTLDKPIKAAAAIREMEKLEKRHGQAHKHKIVDRTDYDAFRPLAIRLKWALGVIANSKSAVRPKCIAVFRGRGNQGYCIITARIIYSPVDGHLADVTWELAPLDNIPVKIGLEIPVVARLSFRNGKPVGHGTKIYRGSRTVASYGKVRRARLTFHWDVPCKYWAVVSPMGTKGSGAAVTIKPSGIPKKGKSCVPLFVWAPTGIPGDWAGGDWNCSEGVKPRLDYCRSNTLGTVAVCWKARQTGYPFPKCKGLATWCTYKTVTLATRKNGTAPGTVYECRRFRISPK